MPKLTSLPAEARPGTYSEYPVPSRYATVSPVLDFEPEAPAVPLSHYLWILRRHLWKMVAFVGLCVLITLIVSTRLQPLYESTATIDLDLRAPSELVGQGSAPADTNFDADQVLATQMKLIQSDAVLRPVVEQFHLRDQSGRGRKLTPEQAQNAADAPVALKDLKVIRPPSTYLLLISYRSPNPHLAADVANAVTNSYLKHTYDIRIRSSANLSAFMENQIGELKAKMERSGLALAQFEKDLDVINPEEKTSILSARLMQLNTNYATAQAERINKEAAWNAIKSGSLEAAEISTQGQALARLNEDLNQARLQLAVVKSTYGTRHPEYQKASSRLIEVEKQFEDTRRNISAQIEMEYRESLNHEQMLQNAVAETKTEWDRLNARSFEYQQLKQDADADKTLYNELIKKIREADINSGFQDNNIRIADVARPSIVPVFPNIRIYLLLSFFLSSLLAITVALFVDKLDTTLRNPEDASRLLGTNVIGMLPLDRDAALLPKLTEPEQSDSVIPASSFIEDNKGNNRRGSYRSISGFEEAVRTIRNTMLLSDLEKRLHSIVLTSAEPGEGKSTLAAYLAIANAARGTKTLLVDGDLRRPSIHAKFGLTPREGLSNVLTGELNWQDVLLQMDSRPHLAVLPSGPGSHRAADLIGPRLAELLDDFAKHYDLVILDSPPLLGFAECLQMASAADGVLIVSRAGETKREAVAKVVSTLQRIRANVVGVVLNRVTHNTSSEGYAYYGYDRDNYDRKSE